ncbi:tRNA 2-selenouridine(34) synthase MnmH [soil metagenome]
MANRPTSVADMADFTVLIDARSPAEFALDHIPGAINCPVLDDEERRIVGTMYKQQGAFEARRIGGAMVAANLAKHLRERFAEHPKTWKPLVYCWRGGLRSGSMVQWLRLVGWDAQQLAGGYKSYRRHVLDLIADIGPRLQLIVLAGPTGSAKTRVLHALSALGEQVLDLEGCASHKGSVLGALPGVAQPTQKGFDTRLVEQLSAFDIGKPVYVEAESRKIGKLTVPEELLHRLRGSPVIEIDATVPARLAFLLRDYAYLGDSPESLSTQIGLLRDMHSKETIARWQGWALAGELQSLYAELMAQHYDALYARSQSAHLANWARAAKLPTSDLSPTGIADLARRVVLVTPEVIATQERNEPQASTRKPAAPASTRPITAA